MHTNLWLCTHGDFIVLPKRKTKLAPQWPIHSHDLDTESFPYLTNAEQLASKWQFSIFKSWFDLTRVQIPWSDQWDGRSAHSTCTVCFAVLLFYMLAKPKIPTCDSVNSQQRYSAAPLENQAAKPMLHSPHTQLTSLYPILIMLTTWQGSNKFQFWRNWFVLTRVRTSGFESCNLTRETVAQPIRPSMFILLCVLATPKIMSGWVSRCDSAVMATL